MSSVSSCDYCGEELDLSKRTQRFLLPPHHGLQLLLTNGSQYVSEPTVIGDFCPDCWDAVLEAIELIKAVGTDLSKVPSTNSAKKSDPRGPGWQEYEKNREEKRAAAASKEERLFATLTPDTLLGTWLRRSAWHALRGHDICTLADVAKLKPRQVKAVPGVGDSSFETLTRAIKAVGLSMRGGEVSMAELGSRCQELRVDRGWSTKELASRVPLSAAQITSVENGNKALSDEDLAAVATAFDVTPAELTDPTAKEPTQEGERVQ